MPKRILDTNRLVKRFRKMRPYSGKTPTDAHLCADELIKLLGTIAIVSPVELEVIVGVIDAHEMNLTIAFLSRFLIIDKRQTLPEDWEESRRIAKHIGYNARRRDLGDCLIAAIADRLKHEVLTNDTGLKQQMGRTRQRGS